eukprot:gene8845-9793_t
MSMRLRVFAAYRALHRARQQVFKNDQVALEAGKYKIREEFRKNLNEKSQESILKHIKTAEDTALLLRKTVVQAVLNDEGRYKLNLTEDSYLRNNVQVLKNSMSRRRQQDEA